MRRLSPRGPLIVVRLLGLLAVVGLLNGCAGAWGKQTPATELQDQLVAVDGQTWVVGTHLVTLSPDASVSGTPSVGDRLSVSGRRTDSGELVIDNVQVLADAQPATDASPPESVNSTAPRARPPAADKPDKANKGRKGH